MITAFLDPTVQASTATLLPSADAFNRAVVSAGYARPSAAVYDGFKKTFNAGGFKTEREVAIFLAQVMMTAF